MTQILWLIFLVFWRFFALVFGFFSLVWAPYVFWQAYRQSASAVFATKATAKMLVGAWTVAPVMIAGFIALGAALIPICFVPLLGPLFAAKVLSSYAKLFNRATAYFHLPGKAHVRLQFSSPHRGHQGEPSTFASDFADKTWDAAQSLAQYNELYYHDSSVNVGTVDGQPFQSDAMTPVDALTPLPVDAGAFPPISEGHNDVATIDVQPIQTFEAAGIPFPSVEPIQHPDIPVAWQETSSDSSLQEIFRREQNEK